MLQTAEAQLAQEQRLKEVLKDNNAWNWVSELLEGFELEFFADKNQEKMTIVELRDSVVQKNAKEKREEIAEELKSLLKNEFHREFYQSNYDGHKKWLSANLPKAKMLVRFYPRVEELDAAIWRWKYEQKPDIKVSEFESWVLKNETQLRKTVSLCNGDTNFLDFLKTKPGGQWVPPGKDLFIYRLTATFVSKNYAKMMSYGKVSELLYRLSSEETIKNLPTKFDSFNFFKQYLGNLHLSENDVKHNFQEMHKQFSLLSK